MSVGSISAAVCVSVQRDLSWRRTDEPVGCQLLSSPRQQCYFLSCQQWRKHNTAAELFRSLFFVLCRQFRVMEPLDLCCWNVD